MYRLPNYPLDSICILMFCSPFHSPCSHRIPIPSSDANLSSWIMLKFFSLALDNKKRMSKRKTSIYQASLPSCDLVIKWYIN